MITVGTHLLVDFRGVAACRMTDRPWRSLLVSAAISGGMTPIGEPHLHEFPGGGFTGFLLLAESHIAIHTYPEHEYIAIDIFACGRGDPSQALKVLSEALSPENEHLTTVERGMIG